MNRFENPELVARRQALGLLGAATVAGLATLCTLLSAPGAQAQTAGMERRQERRGARHDRRQERRTGRSERREDRRN